MVDIRLGPAAADLDPGPIAPLAVVVVGILGPEGNLDCAIPMAFPAFVAWHCDLELGVPKPKPKCNRFFLGLRYAYNFDGLCGITRSNSVLDARHPHRNPAKMQARSTDASNRNRGHCAANPQVGRLGRLRTNPHRPASKRPARHGRGRAWPPTERSGSASEGGGIVAHSRSAPATFSGARICDRPRARALGAAPRRIQRLRSRGVLRRRCGRSGSPQIGVSVGS